MIVLYYILSHEGVWFCSSCDDNFCYFCNPRKKLDTIDEECEPSIVKDILDVIVENVAAEDVISVHEIPRDRLLLGLGSCARCTVIRREELKYVCYITFHFFFFRVKF